MTRTGSTPSKEIRHAEGEAVTPEIGSVPMVEIIMPTIAAARPLISEPPDIDAMTLRPSNPKREIDHRLEGQGDASDSGSVRRMSITSPNRLPTTPDMSEMPSASPALPCRFIS